MKLVILMIISSVIALAVDWYIYRRVIRKSKLGRFWKIAFIIYAVLIDTAVVSALIMQKFMLSPDKTWQLHVSMCVVGFFFLNYFPKLTYALVSLGDYVVTRRTSKASHVFGYAGTVLAAVVFCWLLYGQTYGRTRLRVETVELTFAGLPDSFDGLRIAHFSDTHIGTLLDRDKFLKRMVTAINGLDPDIIVQSGDIVNAHELEMDCRVSGILSGLKATYGVYAVLGNHDLGIYVPDTVTYPIMENLRGVVRKQEGLGWHVLRNQTEFITRGDDSISISGVDYPYDPTLNSHTTDLPSVMNLSEAYRGVPGSIFNITISHAPRTWDEILSYGHADLTLSGHIHAMQTKLRVGSWVWSPAMLVHERWSGMYEQNGRYLYVNDGMGTVVYPMRIGAKPEITLYVLHSEK